LISPKENVDAHFEFGQKIFLSTLENWFAISDSTSLELIISILVHYILNSGMKSKAYLASDTNFLNFMMKLFEINLSSVDDRPKQYSISELAVDNLAECFLNLISEPKNRQFFKIYERNFFELHDVSTERAKKFAEIISKLD